MSFLKLPYELQEVILVDQDKSDLVSLCLVSKSTLYLSLSLLYHCVHLELYSPEREKNILRMESLDLEEKEPKSQEYEELEKELKATELQQDKLFSTFERQPDWTRFVRKVNLWAVYPFDRLPQATRFGRFLSSRANLRQLSMLQRGRDPTDQRERGFFKKHLPKTLTALELEGSTMSALAVLDLLSNLPLLEDFAFGSELANDRYLLIVPKSTPRLSHLTHLRLSWPFQSRSFFSALTTFVPPLIRLHVNFVTIGTLIPARLVNLRELVIFGDMVGIRGEFNDYGRTLPEDLLGLFKSCQKLEKLSMTTMGLNPHSMITILEQIKLFHYLPSTLSSLYLSSFPLTRSYLLDFLSSTSTLSITDLTLSPPPLPGSGGGFFARPKADEAGKRLIEKVCERRKIHLTWGF